MRIILRSTDSSDNERPATSPDQISNGPVFRSVSDAQILQEAPDVDATTSESQLDAMSAFVGRLNFADDFDGTQLEFGFWQDLKSVHPDMSRKAPPKKGKARRK